LRLSVLSNHQDNFSLDPTLTISMQILTNYETYIFTKWGGTVFPPRGSASVVRVDAD